MRSLPAVVATAIAVSACGTATGATPDSGISGSVVAGPTCPVETVPPQPQCAPRPIVVRVRIHRAGSHSAIVVRSNTHGRFRVRLAPGTYVVRGLRKRGSPYPRPPAAATVRVRGDRFTTVTLTYDTGIR